MAGSFGRGRGASATPASATVHEVAVKMLARRALSPQELKDRRYNKYRRMGAYVESGGSMS